MREVFSSPAFMIQPHILQNGGNSISALIASRFGESTEFGLSVLMAAGPYAQGHGRGLIRNRA
jgi:hypothetical protein